MFFGVLSNHMCWMQLAVVVLIIDYEEMCTLVVFVFQIDEI